MKTWILLLILASCNTSKPENDLPPSRRTAFTNVSDTNLKSTNLGNNSMDGEAIDINKDGYVDIILAIEFRPNVLLINDGKGNLVDESNQRFPRAAHDSEDIAVADFDGDGDLDIVFVSEDDQINEFYLNDGQAAFSSAKDRIPVQGTSNAVETVDINLDGFMDLIIGNRGQNFLLVNDGKGYFSNESSKRLPPSSATTQDIELGDIDGDENLDIIEANETHNRILINDGQGFFQDETNARFPNVNDQTREVDLADIDNDGDLDIFFANVDFGGVGDPQNRLLLNQRNGQFEEITKSALPASNFRTVDADFFDINQDGWMDIISGNRFNGTEMLVLINNKNRQFTDKTGDYFPDINSYVFDFQFVDFNNDRKMDIYFCNFRGEDILLLGR